MNTREALRTFHPYLFSAFPALSIFSQNVFYVPLSSIAVTIAVSFAVTLTLIVVTDLFLRNARKSGLVVSLLIWLIFSYSTILRIIEPWTVAGIAVGRHRYLLAFQAVIFALVLCLVARTKHSLGRATTVINAFAVFAVLSASVSTAATFLQGKSSSRPKGENFESIKFARNAAPAFLPDIYYLVLDGLGRPDVLEELYQIDEGELVRGLESNGFNVAAASTSNYSNTPQSVCAALNMEYLDKLFSGVSEDTKEIWPLVKAIRDSRIARVLKANFGYRIVSFASGYQFTELRSADFYLGSGLNLGEFGNALLNLTPLPILVEKVGHNVSPYGLHRRRVLFTIKSLPEIAAIEEPTFTFAHIIAPHPPFVFDEYGADTSPRGIPYSWWDGIDEETPGRRLQGLSLAEAQSEYRQGYRAQTKFIVRMVERAVAEILELSPEAPIIIIQGDHGPRSHSRAGPQEPLAWERFSIFSAVYLPRAGSADFVAESTPVNTFRLILKEFFGADIELLPDENYWSDYSRPFLSTPAQVPRTSPYADAESRMQRQRGVSNTGGVSQQ